MKKILKICSILCFGLSIPLLILINWYFFDFGLLAMFISIAAGLIFDQIRRIFYPNFTVDSLKLYRRNKTLKLIALLLFLLSPMALIYGNRAQGNLGTIFFFVLVGLGLLLDLVANIRFPFSKTSAASQT